MCVSACFECALFGWFTGKPLEALLIIWTTTCPSHVQAEVTAKTIIFFLRVLLFQLVGATGNGISVWVATRFSETWTRRSSAEATRFSRTRWNSSLSVWLTTIPGCISQRSFLGESGQISLGAYAVI